MKEKFEDRILKGKIYVTCKFDDGSVRIWNTRKEEVVQHIIDTVEEYAQEGYILTLRQLHYQLVKSNWIVNHDTAYKKLGCILDDCKYAGIIDWENIEDRGRKPYLPYYVSGIKSALEDTIDQYRLNRQNDQDIYIELWTEKDALSGILRRSTEKYHIQLVVNKGYTSSSAIYGAYQRFVECIENGQNVIILYFGDHDPSGLDMVRDIRERIEFMLLNGEHFDLFEFKSIPDCFKIIPIGLTMNQIKDYNLPPNPTKLTDTRASKYIKKYGKTCWEVDALKPQVLTGIVEANIEHIIDMEKYELMLEREQQDVTILKNFINSKSK
jgi:hypothetical protein